MTIKELRLMKGLTLANFAKSIGIGLSTLTGYEAGKRAPSEKALAAIKEVYGVDLNSKADPASPVEAASAAPVEEKAAEKPARKPRAKKQAALVEATPATPSEGKTAEKPARKPRAKKQTTPVEAAPAAPAEEKGDKKAAKPRAKKPAQIIIQSPMGGEITPEDILSRVGDVDKVYVRLDQNAIYWVKGEETGAINIW